MLFLGKAAARSILPTGRRRNRKDNTLNKKSTLYICPYQIRTEIYNKLVTTKVQSLLANFRKGSALWETPPVPSTGEEISIHSLQLRQQINSDWLFRLILHLWRAPGRDGYWLKCGCMHGIQSSSSFRNMFNKLLSYKISFKSKVMRYSWWFLVKFLANSKYGHCWVHGKDIFDRYVWILPHNIYISL